MLQVIFFYIFITWNNIFRSEKKCVKRNLGKWKYGKVKEVKNLETFYCNWCVEQITKNFTLPGDEKFCIFVTKEKRQTIILTMSYI